MSAIRLLVPVAALAALLAACGKPAATGPASALSKAPEFAKCQWETVKGSSFTMQAFACGPDLANQHVVADDGMPGFVLVKGGARTTAVRLFGKPPTAPVAAVLSSARAVSPGPWTRTCALEPAPGAGAAAKRFVLAPVGDAKTAWERNVKDGKDVIAEPCGPLGVGLAGSRYFYELPGHPETVVFADMGGETQVFDPDTVTPVAR
ncbi:MAG TPA: hypothetical protein VL460_04585 [Caulobacteraceae bacterium]|jgi:hypothetical protein|nr:hypothetical protein [Caulobacteraceae bacterium]